MEISDITDNIDDSIDIKVMGISDITDNIDEWEYQILLITLMNGNIRYY